MSDTVSDLQWMLASRPQKAVLWLRRDGWLWIWLAATSGYCAFEVLRWGYQAWR